MLAGDRSRPPGPAGDASSPLAAACCHMCSSALRRLISTRSCAASPRVSSFRYTCRTEGYKSCHVASSLRVSMLCMNAQACFSQDTRCEARNQDSLHTYHITMNGGQSTTATHAAVGDCTVLRMALTRCANRSVLSVSAMLVAAGLTLAIITVFALPPRDS